jgi:putative hydrolase of the HAD superfamily
MTTSSPIAALFLIALDILQVPLDQIVYIEGRDMLVEVAKSLGIRGIHHQGYETTQALARSGLRMKSEV